MRPFIYNIIFEEGSGILRFSVAHWMIDYILDFTRGVCRYDLQVALSFRSAYVARLYMLCAGQTSKFVVSVTFLKTFLGVEEKYKQTAMFLRRCIDPAVKEIEKKNVSGFRYETITGQRGKVEKIVIIPVKRGEEKERRRLGQGSLSVFCSKHYDPIPFNVLRLLEPRAERQQRGSRRVLQAGELARDLSANR